MYYPRIKQHVDYGPAQIGRKFNYIEYTPLGHKKHYWGIYNKNFGFYTSDQMEQLQNRAHTEGSTHEPSSYHLRHEQFLVNHKNPSIVHCCTCHNNPLRYSKDTDQRCQFCLKHKKSNPYKRSELSILNPEDSAQKQRPSHLVDQIIQVQLPRLPKHTHRRQQSCLACKDKKNMGLRQSDSHAHYRSVNRVPADNFLVKGSTKPSKGKISAF